MSGRAINDLLTSNTNADGAYTEGIVGNDTLLSGQFDDVLTGDLGHDLLTGENRADQSRSLGSQSNVHRAPTRSPT